MKNKTLFGVLIAAAILLFIGCSLFVVLRGVAAAEQWERYVDVYRERATQYMTASPEMTERYGNEISVRFDSSYTYSLTEPQGFFDRYLEMFRPQPPESLVGFTASVKRLRFTLYVGGDAYEMGFEKDAQGELAVSGMSEKP